MKKKILALLLTLTTLLSVMGLPGCGDQSESQSENTLTLLVKKSDIENIYMQRIIDLYEEQTDVKIKTIVVEDVDFEAEAIARFERGDIPDIIQHFNDSTLNYLNVSENFYYMNNEEWVDELTDGAKAYCLDSEGNILGLPFWESSVSGCYYNKKLLDELGLRPAATQMEFDALCQALQSIGYTPMYWAANGCNWMFQFGLDPIFADNPELLEQLNRNQITYADIPEVVQMVEWLDEANKKGWFNDSYADADWDDIAPAMGSGEAVCVFIWDTWFSTDFQEGKNYSDEDFALMPVFMGTADRGTYEGGNMNMLMVNKNSPRLELALDFLSFCATAENYNAAFDGVFTVNCFEGQTTNIQSPMVTNAAASIRENQRPSTVWPKIIGYKQDDVGDAVRKLFEGKVDVAGCISLMDEYRINAAGELGAEGFIPNSAVLDQDTNADDIFKAVLLGDTQFLYVSDGNLEAVNITDVPSIFDAYDSFMKIWEFSVVDLNGDGEEEVILFVVGVAGDMGGKMILHQIGGEVYGYMSDNRTLVNLKADGTYDYSDPTGVVEAGIGTVIDFSESGYTVDKISYGTGTYEGWNTFAVDHQSATEEEYLDAVARQDEKRDAERYDFTNENIIAVF